MKVKALVSSFLKTRTAWGLAILLFLQQALVAASSFFLIRAAQTFQSGGRPFAWCWAYLAALVLPYFPGIASLVQLRRWQFQCRRIYLSQSNDALKNRIGTWASPAVRKRLTGIYATESGETLNLFLSYCHSSTACALNPALLYCYALTFTASAFYLFLRSKRAQALSNAASDESSRLSGVLSLFWDNLLLGNAHNRATWTQNADHAFDRSRRADLTSARYQASSYLVVSLMNLVPSSGVMAYLLWTHAANASFWSAFLVTLPRAFQVLISVNQLLSSIGEFSAHQGRLKVLCDGVSPQKDDEGLAGRLSWKALKVSLDGQSVDAGTLLERMQPGSIRPQFGRVTIQGENGSGKSSLALLIKVQLKEEAFYLPAHHQLLFDGVSESGSTGERLRATIQALGRAEQASVWILDEWDANLDRKNMDMIHRILEEASKHRLVIEIRHREAISVNA